MNPLRRLLGLLTRNFGWKLLSLGAAVVIWALVASEPELSTFENATLEYRNVPDELEISNSPRTPVTLELRGPALELSREGRRPAVVIDMSGMGPGQHTFPISSQNVSVARGVRLVRAIPAEVQFEFDRRMTRSIPVQVQWKGEGTNGYVVARSFVLPDTLEITGPAGHVQGIAAATTDPVNVSAVVGTSQFRVNAYVSDSYVRLRSSPQVVVTVSMRKK